MVVIWQLAIARERRQALDLHLRGRGLEARAHLETHAARVQRIKLIGIFIYDACVDCRRVVVADGQVAHAILVSAFGRGSEENLAMCKVIITIAMTCCVCFCVCCE